MKVLKSFMPFMKYGVILFLVVMLVLFIIPHLSSDAAFGIFFTLIMFIPFLYIGNVILTYKIGKRMQNLGKYPTHFVRITFSALCGIGQGILIPLAFEIEDLLRWGHINTVLIRNSLIGEFEYNWPTQIMVVLTFLSLWVGMEVQYK